MSPAESLVGGGGHFTSTIGGVGGHFPGRRPWDMSQHVATSALATVRLFFRTKMNQIEKKVWKRIELNRRNVIAFVIGRYLLVGMMLCA
jgi:hypothetical protein